MSNTNAVKRVEQAETEIAVLQVQFRNLDEKIDEIKVEVKDLHDCLDRNMDETKIILKEFQESNKKSHDELAEKISGIEKIKWIIEGTMKDFDRMYNEKAEFYIKLADSYDILYDKMNLKHNNTCLLLEDLVILENNIEVCDNILNILSIFYIDDYKLLFQIESGYMSLFIYNLIENIRMYKIMCMSKF